MEPWQLAKLVETINKLKKRDKTGIHNMMTYVLIPYVTSMGYDVYNFDNAEISLDEGKISVKVADKADKGAEKLSLVASLTSDKPYCDEERIFLYIDGLTPAMTLYFKVLDTWEQVISVNLTDKAGTTAYTDILKYIKRDRLVQEYRQKGERILTEGVIDRQLSAGTWDNDFMLNALVAELKNPSAGLVEVLAKSLCDKYTTKEPAWIQERIAPMQEAGLLSLIERASDRGMLATGITSTYTEVEEPVYVAPVVEEPVTAVESEGVNVDMSEPYGDATADAVTADGDSLQDILRGT